MPRSPVDIRTARAYGLKPGRGRFRVLVDRVWPRGVKKEQLALDAWMKEIAPSTELRKWFHHDPERWEEFRARYHRELAQKDDLVDELLEAARRGPVLLIYAARDEEYNNAAALQEYLESAARR